MFLEVVGRGLFATATRGRAFGSSALRGARSALGVAWIARRGGRGVRILLRGGDGRRRADRAARLRTAAGAEVRRGGGGVESRFGIDEERPAAATLSPARSPLKTG